MAVNGSKKFLQGWKGGLTLWAIRAGISATAFRRRKKKEKERDSEQSYYFSGALNTRAEGNPVPAAHGELIKVGSYEISTNTDYKGHQFTNGKFIAQDLVSCGVFGGLQKGKETESIIYGDDRADQFDSLAWDQRFGEDPQEPSSIVQDPSSSEQPNHVFSPATSANPEIRSYSFAIERIEISIKFPTGLYAMGGVFNNDKENNTNKIFYRAYKEGSSPPANFGWVKLGAEQTNSFIHWRKIEINRPPGVTAGNWMVEMYAESDNWSEHWERAAWFSTNMFADPTISSNLGYPGYGYITTSISAEDVPSPGNRAFIIHPKLIRIPEAYRPPNYDGAYVRGAYDLSGSQDLRTSGGAGTLNNLFLCSDPALIVLDMLTDPHCGNGLNSSEFGFDDDSVNYDDLIALSRHNSDENVSFNGGCRYTFNFNHAVQSGTYSAIQDVLQSCQATAYEYGGEVRFFQDKLVNESDKAALISQDYIISGSISYSSSKYEEILTGIQVTYINKDQTFESETFSMTTPGGPSESVFGSRYDSFDLIGVTNKNQAERHGAFILEDIQASGLQFLELSVSYYHESIKPGSVVYISDDGLTKINNASGRIIDVRPGNKYLLDRDVIVRYGKMKSNNVILRYMDDNGDLKKESVIAVTAPIVPGEERSIVELNNEIFIDEGISSYGFDDEYTISTVIDNSGINVFEIDINYFDGYLGALNSGSADVYFYDFSEKKTVSIHVDFNDAASPNALAADLVAKINVEIGLTDLEGVSASISGNTVIILTVSSDSILSFNVHEDIDSLNQFRVMAVTTNSQEGVYDLQLEKYDPFKYARIEGQNFPPTEGPVEVVAVRPGKLPEASLFLDDIYNISTSTYTVNFDWVIDDTDFPATNDWVDPTQWRVEYTVTIGADVTTEVAYTSDLSLAILNVNRADLPAIYVFRVFGLSSGGLYESAGSPTGTVTIPARGSAPGTITYDGAEILTLDFSNDFITGTFSSIIDTNLDDFPVAYEVNVIDSTGNILRSTTIRAPSDGASATFELGVYSLDQNKEDSATGNGNRSLEIRVDSIMVNGDVALGTPGDSGTPGTGNNLGLVPALNTLPLSPTIDFLGKQDQIDVSVSIDAIDRKDLKGVWFRFKEFGSNYPDDWSVGAIPSFSFPANKGTKYSIQVYIEDVFGPSPFGQMIDSFSEILEAETSHSQDDGWFELSDTEDETSIADERNYFSAYQQNQTQDAPKPIAFKRISWADIEVNQGDIAVSKLANGPSGTVLKGGNPNIFEVLTAEDLSSDSGTSGQILTRSTADADSPMTWETQDPGVDEFSELIDVDRDIPIAQESTLKRYNIQYDKDAASKKWILQEDIGGSGGASLLGELLDVDTSAVEDLSPVYYPQKVRFNRGDSVPYDVVMNPHAPGNSVVRTDYLWKKGIHDGTPFEEERIKYDLYPIRLKDSVISNSVPVEDFYFFLVTGDSAWSWEALPVSTEWGEGTASVLFNGLVDTTMQAASGDTITLEVTIRSKDSRGNITIIKSYLLPPYTSTDPDFVHTASLFIQFTALDVRPDFNGSNEPWSLYVQTHGTTTGLPAVVGGAMKYGQLLVQYLDFYESNFFVHDLRSIEETDQEWPLDWRYDGTDVPDDERQYRLSFALPTNGSKCVTVASRPAPNSFANNTLSTHYLPPLPASAIVSMSQMSFSYIVPPNTTLTVKSSYFMPYPSTLEVVIDSVTIVAEADTISGELTLNSGITHFTSMTSVQTGYLKFETKMEVVGNFTDTTVLALGDRLAVVNMEFDGGYIDTVVDIATKTDPAILEFVGEDIWWPADLSLYVQYRLGSDPNFWSTTQIYIGETIGPDAWAIIFAEFMSTSLSSSSPGATAIADGTTVKVYAESDAPESQITILKASIELV